MENNTEKDEKIGNLQKDITRLSSTRKICKAILKTALTLSLCSISLAIPKLIHKGLETPQKQVETYDNLATGGTIGFFAMLGASMASAESLYFTDLELSKKKKELAIEYEKC